MEVPLQWSFATGRAIYLDRLPLSNRARVSLWGYLCIVALMFLLTVFGTSPRPYENLVFVGSVLAGLGEFAWVNYSSWRMYRRLRGAGSTCSVDRSGIHITYASSARTYSWSGFISWREAPRFFELCRHHPPILYLPKAGLDAGQLAALRQLLVSCTGKSVPDGACFPTGLAQPANGALEFRVEWSRIASSAAYWQVVRTRPWATLRTCWPIELPLLFFLYETFASRHHLLWCATFVGALGGVAGVLALGSQELYRRTRSTRFQCTADSKGLRFSGAGAMDTHDWGEFTAVREFPLFFALLQGGRGICCLPKDNLNPVELHGLRCLLKDHLRWLS